MKDLDSAKRTIARLMTQNERLLLQLREKSTEVRRLKRSVP